MHPREERSFRNRRPAHVHRTFENDSRITTLLIGGDVEPVVVPVSVEPEPSEDRLAETDIHHVLSNERRRLVLELLRDGDEAEMSARELSERIAAIETNEDPPPRNIRQSVYVSLHQTHLPKMDDFGIVRYDDSSKSVELTDRFGSVGIYLETVPTYGIAWSEYYLLVSVLGALLVGCAELGVPMISAIGSVPYAVGTFLLIALSAGYQTYQQGSSVLTRLMADDA